MFRAPNPCFSKRNPPETPPHAPLGLDHPCALPVSMSTSLFLEPSPPTGPEGGDSSRVLPQPCPHTVMHSGIRCSRLSQSFVVVPQGLEGSDTAKVLLAFIGVTGGIGPEKSRHRTGWPFMGKAGIAWPTVDRPSPTKSSWVGVVSGTQDVT